MPSQTARVDGLIRLTEVGLFGDNIEIGALQTRFQSQVGIIWPRTEDTAVQINARLSADEIDFDLIRPMSQAQKPAEKKLPMIRFAKSGRRSTLTHVYCQAVFRWAGRSVAILLSI